MWWSERLESVVRLAVAGLGALALWAFVVNRELVQWVDGPLKHLSIASFGLGLAAIAAATVWRRTLRKATWLWLGLLALFAAGEQHRRALRQEYRADSRSTGLWPVVTTTDLEVRRFTAAVPAAGARWRVLHVSDLHVHENTPSGFIERVAREMAALDPDISIFTGDFVSRADRVPVLARALGLLPRARFGSYAVLGNHDYWMGDPEAVRMTLREAGIEPIGGRCVDVVAPGPIPWRLCGTEAPWGPDYPHAPGATGPTLVLSHTPDNVYALARRDATAVFAGHTHAGQIRIPLLGALIVPSDYGRRFDEGHFQVDGTHLFVSAGVGADAPAIRLWCRPALVVVDFVGR